MGSIGCLGAGQGNWKSVLFQSTLLVSAIALTILGGLKLSSVINLRGVNSLAFIGTGAGLVGALGIYQAILCVKQKCGKSPTSSATTAATIEAPALGGGVGQSGALLTTSTSTAAPTIEAPALGGVVGQSGALPTTSIAQQHATLNTRKSTVLPPSIQSMKDRGVVSKFVPNLSFVIKHFEIHSSTAIKPFEIEGSTAINPEHDGSRRCVRVRGELIFRY